MIHAGKANALAVECAGCVAAIAETTAAVNTANATLTEVKTLLTTLVNHLNQIRLAVGPPATTASAGSLAQQTDFRNFPTLTPDFKGFDLKKGVKIDLGDLDGLKTNLNDMLQIYTDASKIKAAVDQGRYSETVADMARIAKRRNTVYSRSVETVLGTSLYSLNQSGAAKATELSLDTGRLGALNLQAKANAASKIQMQILGRLNHLIALMAAQMQMDGAQNLRSLPRQVIGTEELTPPPPPAGSAQTLFGRTVK